MTRKILAGVTIIVAVVLLGADAPKDDVKDVEKALAALNEAYSKRDADAIHRLTITEHVSVTTYYGGPATRAEQLASLVDLKISDYTAAKTKVTLLNKETALVTYELTTKGTFKGKALPAKCFASAVWVKRDGAWLEAYYQETPLEDK
jgi:ketosteroid isomerase-like protein